MMLCLCRYLSAIDLDSVSISAGMRTYGGGGYVFRFRGQIHEIEENLQRLMEKKWVDQKTRALLLEFSVYNAQVSLVFLIVACQPCQQIFDR